MFKWNRMVQAISGSKQEKNNYLFQQREVMTRAFSKKNKFNFFFFEKSFYFIFYFKKKTKKKEYTKCMTSGDQSSSRICLSELLGIIAISVQVFKIYNLAVHQISRHDDDDDED